MAKPYKLLRDKLFTPEQQVEHEAEAKVLLAEVPLAQLRQAMELTQAQLADVMGMTQPSVAQMEKQADMLIGTLRSYIVAMGGELELRARFAEGDVVITQFRRAGASAGGEVNAS